MSHGLAIARGLGIPPIDASRSATSGAADLLGISRTTGTLEKGKIADVVAIPGDPIVDITATERLSFVMKDGRIVKNDNR